LLGDPASPLRQSAMLGAALPATEGADTASSEGLMMGIAL
jgi:hypothetical protein